MNRFISMLEHAGRASKTVGKTIGKDAAIVAEVAAPIALPMFPGGSIASQVVTGVLSLSHGENSTMNPLEQFAVTMILGMLQTAVKNPAHKSALQTQLLGVADDIYMTYGKVPPMASAPSPSATTTPTIAAQ
jgi:hypothetical protein